MDWLFNGFVIQLRFREEIMHKNITLTDVVCSCDNQSMQHHVINTHVTSKCSFQRELKGLEARH